MDKVMSYAPVRDIKCAKTFFAVSGSLDQTPAFDSGFDRVLGLPFEIVPLVSPVGSFHAGGLMRVRILFKGKPMANTRVSFIPKGTQLRGEFDSAYEKKTDANGEAELALKEGNLYLIAAHYTDVAAKGKGYQSIGYSATLCVAVPGI